MTVAHSWINGPNIQIGSAAGNVTIALDRPDYQVQWLHPAPPQGFVPARHRTPSRLLDTRREVVPYRDRPVEQKLLLEWRDDPGVPVSVLLVHGAGGRGKTRLANAFAAQSHAAGWSVAQAVSRVPSSFPVSSPTVSAGVLVVVDYAERWAPDTLLALITDLMRSYPGPLRVLLLARSIQDLWTELSDHLDRLPVELPDPMKLGDLTAPEERRDAFLDAALAFHRALDVSGAPAVSPPDDLAHPDYASPLILHMAALAAVCASRDHEALPDRDSLSGYLLTHERRYWESRALAGDVVFLATLFGPLSSETEALALLGTAGVSADRDLIRWHDRLYPAESVLSPLRPDRFGEDFLAAHVAEYPRAVSLLDRLADDVEDFDREAWQRCLIVLAASAERHAHVREVLWSVLTRFPQLSVCASPPMIRTVIRHAPFDVAFTVANGLPMYNTVLLRPAVELTQHVLELLPDTGSERAHLFDLLGVRLSHAGDPRTANAAASAAIEISRALGDTALLAMCLNNHSTILAKIREYREAQAASQEAVALYRQLAEADPGYLPNVAHSLNNLSIRLATSGRLDAGIAAAREAADIYDRLLDDEPGHLPDYAMALNNLSSLLGENDANDEAVAIARVAVSINRQLAEAAPAAYLPQLASSLTNLGDQLSEAGESDEAVEVARESVAISRRLAETEPVALLPDLASGLLNLGVYLGRAGDSRAAVAPLREAVDINRRLAATDFVAHADNLANSMLSLGTALTNSGEPETGLAAQREAVALYLEIEALADAGSALCVIAGRPLIDPGLSHELPDAMAAAEEAVGIYRTLGMADDLQLAESIREYLANIPPTTAPNTM